MKKNILLFGILFCIVSSKAQDSINIKLNQIIAKQNSKVLKIGLSVGTRFFLESEANSRAVASILPDSTVAIEHGDKIAVVLSSSFTAFPFVLSKHKWVQGIGFTININLAEFTNNKVGAVFNKPIDGGMGFAYAIGPNKEFAVALTFERISVLRPTSFVINKEGQKIIDKGRAVTSLDKTDNRYYIDSGLNGWSIKFIYHFN